jgi:uncharacterized protein (DUF58 family)
MRRRIVTTICPEGWYYLFVVAFILGGATLRGVNLLIVLGGMLIGPFLFNWRVVTLMLRRVRLERPLPQRVSAGQVLHVPVSIQNDRQWLSSWTVVVEDRIRRVDRAERDGVTRVRVMAPRIAPRHSWSAGYEALLSRRGRYRFGPLRVSTRFPLGLAKASFTQQEEATLLVCPRLGQLTPQWLHVTGRDQHGDRRNAQQHGFLEGDYYGLREWRPGDSKRWIHWRTSARLGKLAVRQFERQRQRDVAVVLDLWQDNAPARPAKPVVETAVSFLATAVANLAGHGETHAVIAVAGRQQRLWASSASTVLTHEVWDHLALAQGAADAPLAELLPRVRQQARPDTPLIVISTRAASEVQQLPATAATAGSRGRNGRGQAKTVWIDCSRGEHLSYFQVALEEEAMSGPDAGEWDRHQPQPDQTAHGPAARV